MSLLQTEVIESSASRRANQNFRANTTALRMTQPSLSFDSPPSVPWLFARDGSLTARQVTPLNNPPPVSPRRAAERFPQPKESPPPGRWWAGCSLPLRAGRALLKKLNVQGVTACMLAPTYAGQVSAALAKLNPQQALIVIQPNPFEAALMLSCHDFTADIHSNRLWLATGDQWATELRQIFDDHPGLPLPSQFIRLPVTPEEISTPIIRTAEPIFNAITIDREAKLKAIQRRVMHRLLIVAPTHFRLWDDAGHAMISALASDDTQHLDPDDPAHSSALGLAIACATCEALLVADRSRAELPPTVPAEVPVLTWITTPRLPAFDPAHPHDALLLADEHWLAPAQLVGWPANRLAIAHWPAIQGPAPAADSPLVLIADTHSLETPTTELELSSHHVLWEQLRTAILDSPFAVTSDPTTYIHRARQKLGIAEEGFNLDFFLNRLLIPAYQQAIAVKLLKADIPLHMHGKGWESFGNQHHGRINSRADFQRAATAPLIYPHPIHHRHPIEALGQRVIYPQLNESSLLRAARNKRSIASNPSPQSPLTRRSIDALLNDSFSATAKVATPPHVT